MMKELEQQLLQFSAKIFQLLSHVPIGEERSTYMEKVDAELDERGKVIAKMHEESVLLSKDNSSHRVLLELDQGIQERLKLVMASLKKDMKNMQSSKKNEEHYINPYSSVRVMDGKYYDQKK